MKSFARQLEAYRNPGWRAECGSHTAFEPDIHNRMIRISDHVVIDEDEFEEHFIRASGPGGQNVNKVSSAVELRFDVRRSRSLPDDVAVRLMRLAGRRLAKDGILVIRADRFRSQAQNRADARARLSALVRQALVVPKARVRTKPTKAARERRLEGKRIRGRTKSLRQKAQD